MQPPHNVLRRTLLVLLAMGVPWGVWAGSITSVPLPTVIATIDGQVSGVYTTLKVTNGTLVDNADGTVTLVVGNPGNSGDVFSAEVGSAAGGLIVWDGVGGKTIQAYPEAAGILKTDANGVVSPATSADIITLVGDADANDITKGVATFNNQHFNAAFGVVSLDLVNGPKAGDGTTGYLTAADWATFNAKQNALTAGVDYATPAAVALKADQAVTIGTSAPLGGGGDLSGNRTLTCTTCTTNAAPLTLNAPVFGAGAQGVAVGTRSGTTTEVATVSGAKTTQKQLAFDAGGNVVASTTDIGQGGHTIADEGTPLVQQRTILNFAGEGISCADDTDKTTCTVSGAAAGDADDDGVTKGIATFTNTDFDVVAGVVSLAYTTGQVATGAQPGFLSAADWTTFNTKQAALGFTPENVANKSTDTALGTSDTAYPSQNAVKVYVDAAVGAAGGGDITSVGNCAGPGACLDGSATGGSTVSLYDGDSHAATLQTANLSGARTFTLPNESGTVCTTGSVCTGYQAALGFTAVPTTTTVNGQPLSGNVTLTKSDVGLGNVDNTSDATKNAAAVTLTNKTIALGSNIITGAIADFNTALTDGNFLMDAAGNGLVVRTGTSTTTARSLAGTTNEIEISNGDGTGGNPTIGIPNNAELSVIKLTNLGTDGVLTTTLGTGTLAVSTQALTQSGLTWNVTTSTCTTDPNGGTLTIEGTEIVCRADDGGAGGTAFSAVTAGTNTGQALVIGNGSTLGPTGTGTITATHLPSSAAGLVEVDAQGFPSLAEAADVVAIFGGGTCSGYLKSDGSCDTPPVGDVSVTVGQTPVNGQIATWTDASHIQGLDSSGTGNVVRVTGATLETPTLGVASATSINKVTMTAPATSATLTIADGKTLTTSNTLTLTGTDGSSVAFGAGGTVAYTAGTLAQFAATTSADLAGVLSDESGTTGGFMRNPMTASGQLLYGGAGGAPAALTSGQGILRGNGTSAPTFVTGSTTGNVLRITGANTFAFGQLDLGNANAVTGDLLYANLTPSTAASQLLGRGSAAGAGDWEPVTLGAGGLLSMTGTTLAVSGLLADLNTAITDANLVPEARTLDINGTTFEIEVDQAGPLDLAGNRAWQIGIPANAQLSVAKLLNLTNNGVVITSGGDGTLQVGTLSGNTTEFGTITGTKTTGKQLAFDASGNIIASTSDLGTVTVSGTPVLGQAAEWVSASALQGVAVTGSGNYVKATSPSLTTPSLGVATATSINKVAVTAPATSATLTIADGKTLTTSNTLTLTGTDGSSVAFGTGGTVAYTGGTLGQFAATSSAQLAGVLSDESGTNGGFVRAFTSSTVGQVLRVTGADTFTFGAVDLADTDAITNDLPYANLTAATAASRLLGRGSAAGAGDWQEVTLGAGLAMTGTVLSATGAGGDVTAVPTPLNNQVGVWTGATTLEGDAALTFDTGGNVLSIGTAGTAPGSLRLANADASAETVTFTPASGVLGNTTITVPGITGTLAIAGTLAEGQCVKVTGGKLVTAGQDCNTFTDVRLPPRTVTLTINAGHGELVGPETADYVVHDALPSGTILDCPTGTATDNETITFKFKTATSVPFSWNAGCYSEAANLDRPTATSGNNTWDIYKYLYDAASDTYILIAKATEASGEVGTTFGISEVDAAPSGIVDALVVPNGSLSIMGNTATLDVLTAAGTATLTNKRLTPRIQSMPSTASLTPDFGTYDQIAITALAATLTVEVPTGTPTDGEMRQITIKDDGTQRALVWIGGANGFAAEGDIALPTTTIVGRTGSYQFRWNASTSRWGIVGSTIGTVAITKYVASFPAATSWDLAGTTHNIPTQTPLLTCWDDATPRKLLSVMDVSIDASFNIHWDWVTAQAGHCVIGG